MTERICAMVVVLACALPAQVSKPETKAPSPAELAATSARGKMLAEYDVAASHADDAVAALQPDPSIAPLYLARKMFGQWEVVYGRLTPNRDRFLIVYRATQGATPTEFTAKKLDPPAEDRGFYLGAAKAAEIANRDFGNPGRPYNTYVLPTEDGRLYVYLLPGQTREGVYPLGGDVRYTITLDGSTIADKRQMHKTIIEKKEPVPEGTKLAGGYHTHVLNNEIEESDVFHVLVRTPSIPEYVGTPDKHMYEIATDGTIKRVQ